MAVSVASGKSVHLLEVVSFSVQWQVPKSLTVNRGLNEIILEMVNLRLAWHSFQWSIVVEIVPFWSNAA